MVSNTDSGLFVKLLYGCGLRISECLHLRVNAFNIEMGVLTIHDGKGGKARTVPFSETLVPVIHSQLVKAIPSLNHSLFGKIPENLMDKGLAAFSGIAGKMAKRKCFYFGFPFY